MPTTDNEIRSDPPIQDGGSEEPLVSVVIPCLNEAASIERCVELAYEALAENGLSGEVVVADNASEDGSAALARAAGAQVADEPRRGYGSAYLAGLARARGKYVVMLDADLTYDFKEIPRFVEALEHGADLVIGNRRGHIEPGAMHWLHRYVGNPLLTGILNLLFKTAVKDTQCGMRALRRDIVPRLDLRTTGMEFASEMVVRAAKEGLEIDELPIRYHPRSGESKLSRFRDGWRHLRFLLVHSPMSVFVVPGALMFLVGVLVMLTVIANIDVLGRKWEVHTMIAGSLLTIIGTQIGALGLCAYAYFMREQAPWFHWARERFRLEHGLAAGSALLLAGLVVAVVIVIKWIDRGFSELAEAEPAILAATLIVIGTQVVFSSFLLSVIGLRRPPADEGR
jgi:glycosyltransferase involved in cell wall biosynthesis